MLSTDLTPCTAVSPTKGLSQRRLLRGLAKAPAQKRLRRVSMWPKVMPPKTDRHCRKPVTDRADVDGGSDHAPPPGVGGGRQW